MQKAASPQELGRRIELLRQRRGWTAEDFARELTIAGYRITLAGVRKLELGQSKKVDAFFLAAAARVFDIDINMLMGSAEQASEGASAEAMLPPGAIDIGDMVPVPVLGTVPAGRPIVTEQHVERFQSVPRGWLRNASGFALQVRGDSMTGIGISDGDTVIIRYQEEAHEGDVVAITINGETCLKRLMFQDNAMVLMPENPAHAPIEVHGGEVKIHGVLVGLMRAYTTSGRPGNGGR